MTTLINKIDNFLREHPQNAISVTQGERRLSKQNAPKYVFYRTDIEQLFGGAEAFLKNLPQQGFTNGTSLIFRRMYGSGSEATSKIFEKITLNFSPQGAVESPIAMQTTNVQPVAEMQTPVMPAMYASQTAPASQATFVPQTASVPQMGFAAMGYVQTTQNELIRNEVIKERFEDLKKENNKLDEELKEAKSEIRQLKDENFSLRLKLDTIEDKHEVKLERELLNKKGFWESEAGSNIVGALGQVLPMVAEKMMESPASMAPALASPASALSEVKQQFISIISSPEVTDE
ncbi:hypothetical protein, partial [Capnocytophaga sp.]|uniref:hypothetical protein n=1 Tax=Capnocytophaga sp. TaxID=44737 RepID=UPI0026DDC18B